MNHNLHIFTHFLKITDSDNEKAQPVKAKMASCSLFWISLKMYAVVFRLTILTQ